MQCSCCLLPGHVSDRPPPCPHHVPRPPPAALCVSPPHPLPTSPPPRSVQGKFVFQWFGWITAASATPFIMLCAGSAFFGLSLAANQGISVAGMSPAAMALAGAVAGAVTQVRPGLAGLGWAGLGWAGYSRCASLPHWSPARCTALHAVYPPPPPQARALLLRIFPASPLARHHDGNSPRSDTLALSSWPAGVCPLLQVLPV